MAPLPVSFTHIRRLQWSLYGLVMDQQSTTFDHVAKAQPPVQRSQAQQKLYRIEQIPQDQKLAVATQNQIALLYAQFHLTKNKIDQLQQIVFGKDKKPKILENISKNFLK